VTFALDLDAATSEAQSLATIIASEGAERLLVMAPEIGGGRVFPGPAVALAVQVSLAVAVEVVTISEADRKRHGNAASKLVPKGSGSMATRDALAMVLADMGPVTAPPAITVAPAVAVSGNDVAVSYTVHDPIVAAVLAPAPIPPPAPAAPRVAGIDPGERWIAACVGAETGVPAAPLAYVASLVVEIERTGKEQPTDEQLDVAVGKAVDFCELHGVERAVVERAVNVHRAPGKSAEEGAGLAAYLLRGQYVAGMLRGALRAARNAAQGALIPGRVESVSSVKGRNYVRRLQGQRTGATLEGPRPPWQPFARACFGGTIPAGVGEHVLDAAVCAVWATRPEEEPKAAARPAGPGKPRPGKHAADKAKRAEARRTAGCACEGRHVAGCPVQVAANAKRAAKMAGNGNARKGRTC
jgi:hypothetical protein